MLTTKQFDSLKPGDVLIVNGRPRTVREAHTTVTKRGVRRVITFSILRRSWTGRICTVYGYNDIKHRARLPRKDVSRREVCKAEEAALVTSRFDVPRQVDREIAEAERLVRCGFEEDRAAMALLKQTQRKFKRRKEPKE